MKKQILLCLLLFPLTIIAQEADERDAVVRTIETIFNGMRTGDSTAMRAVFLADARLQTTFIDKEGQPRITEGSIDRWLEGVAKPKEEAWDEKIWSYDVQIDQGLATVWTEYSFYLGEKLLHCGVNAFHLFKDEDGWKIFQITDTRRNEGCITPDDDPKMAMEKLIDDWHLAASNADATVFFGSMTSDAVYIGTDAGERWLRDELREWAGNAFDRESAWDFKPSDRHIQIAADGRTAWWDEKLGTWMGVCRGSGVLTHTTEGWKIQHYQLSVTVPNEKIEGFIELVKE